MFGHQDHDENQDENQNPMPPSTDEPRADATLDMPSPVTLPPTDLPAPTSSAPAVDSSDAEDKAGDFIMTEPPRHGDDSPTIKPDVPLPHANDLLDIKQEALQQLSPLIDHLDQSPEEKFRTTMMMIQAADNQALIKDAYSAAQQITDEKERAQALLDIVNEINYFTQHNEA